MDIAVTELVNPLKIADDSILYAELQLGMQRNTRFGQHKERVRLGLQTSPENFFYDETAFAGAPYVNLNALEFTMLAGDAKTGAYDVWTEKAAPNCGASSAVKKIPATPALFCLTLRPASQP